MSFLKSEINSKLNLMKIQCKRNHELSTKYTFKIACRTGYILTAFIVFTTILFKGDLWGTVCLSALLFFMLIGVAPIYADQLKKND